MSETVIFYIEDNVDNRTLIRRILSAEGYQVVEAGDAKEALEKLKTFHPDMILMDINMPEVDGYTLTSQIRNLAGFESTPIVALTANVMRGDRERSLEAGCDGYIQKPIDIDQFAREIARFMMRRTNA